jgi:hypothetical protein
MQIEQARDELCERLRSRQPEIEQTALARVRSVSGPGEIASPEYTEGLRLAVTAALEYGIEALERSEDRPAPIPTALLSQARLAARHGVELDTVLRRYLAGHTLLDDFLVEESERGGAMNGASLKRVLRVQATVLDRLLAAVSEEYAREAKTHSSSSEQRRIERIERLLAGELLETSGLRYDFEARHTGLVAVGSEAVEAVRGLATALERNLLLVRRGEDSVWAWLGGRRSLDFEQLERAVSQGWPAEVVLAIGEEGEGIAGWRLSHRQAQAALSVALRSTRIFTRYGDVAVLASLLQDDLVAISLHDLYLSPFERGRDGGATARKTLRAYFAAERQVSSAAAMLGINRNTVTKRLGAIEDTLGRPLGSCAAELELALRLQELAEAPPAPPSVAPR